MGISWFFEALMKSKQGGSIRIVAKTFGETDTKSNEFFPYDAYLQHSAKRGS
jgi:hypothetical protein